MEANKTNSVIDPNLMDQLLEMKKILEETKGKLVNQAVDKVNEKFEEMKKGNKF